MSEWIRESYAAPEAEVLCRFVALQPIVQRSRETFGYELLFRASWENRFSSDGDVASQHMVDNVVAFGMDSLVGDRIPFLNCTRDILVRGIPTLLPKNTVLEVLETLDVDEPLLAACRSLRAMGTTSRRNGSRCCRLSRISRSIFAPRHRSSVTT